MSEMISYSIILLVGVFIGAVSQVMLKKSAQKQYGSWIREYLNPLVIGAYALFFATTLLSLIAYKRIPLSLGPILEATNYIYITIFGVVLFKEKIDRRRLLALALIILGIVVYAVFG